MSRVTWVNFALPLSCALAGLGIIAGIVAGRGYPESLGNVRIVSDSAAGATAPQSPAADWIDDARRGLAIRPEQSAAWQVYVNAMSDLQTSRIEMERQLAAGTVRDAEPERGRHAMVLANALSELEKHLSPDQQTKARLLTRILADTVICQELAIR